MRLLHCAGEESLPILLRLQRLKVSKQLLIATEAGKHMKGLTKSATGQVAQAAKAVVEAWKICVLNST